MQIEERTFPRVGVEPHGYSAKRRAIYIGIEARHKVDAITNGVITISQKPTKHSGPHGEERAWVVQSDKNQTKRK
jgi:hypothetical protein